jgi:hypothetical protein
MAMAPNVVLRTHDIKDMGSNRCTQVTTPRPRVKESTKSSWELVSG